MKTVQNSNYELNWKVEKIGVIGPGIVGMPMAALLASASIKIGTEKPAQVVVIQRNSSSSGWKVPAINAGQSVIGGIEPDLNDIVMKAVFRGRLSASHDYENLVDADVILLSIQTDKKPDSPEPDYGPLFSGLTSLAKVLQNKPAHKVPLIVFESTLAPSSMSSVIKDHFANYGLIEGRDILLGNSPNRVMPGRLVERVSRSDKLIAGLRKETPGMIKQVYQHIVQGALHETNCMTAEITKTLENAYRDVRIAYSTEVVRYCDDQNINFYMVRNKVNEKLAQTDYASQNPNEVPSGGMLIPMVGVGGHCLPKDGILLWWRKVEKGQDPSNSIILKARRINDESPTETIRLAERKFGDISGRKIAVLGIAYRFNSEDTRNSPGIILAKKLLDKGCTVTLHDPYVKTTDQNLMHYNLTQHFTNDLTKALADCDYIFFTCAHKEYLNKRSVIFRKTANFQGIIDGCNLYRRADIEREGYPYTGIGRGQQVPDEEFIQSVYEGFKVVEKSMANEVNNLINFLNTHYADEEFNKVDFNEVQHLAATCSTGCTIVDPGLIGELSAYNGFRPALTRLYQASEV